MIASAQFQLIATAFACQVTKVAHVHFSNCNYNKFPFVNGGKNLLEQGWHGVVHCDSGTDDIRLKSYRWYTQLLADLLTRLQSTREGEGSLLDNTMVVFAEPPAALGPYGGRPAHHRGGELRREDPGRAG